MSDSAVPEQIVFRRQASSRPLTARSRTISLPKLSSLGLTKKTDKSRQSRTTDDRRNRRRRDARHTRRTPQRFNSTEELPGKKLDSMEELDALTKDLERMAMALSNVEYPERILLKYINKKTPVAA